MRATVAKLLDLNRPYGDDECEIDLNQVLESAVDLFRIQLKRNGVKINMELSPQIPNVTAAPGQLSHVFLNLFNNALEAMDVSSEFGPSSMGCSRGCRIDVRTYCQNEKVVIEIADNGPGISENDLGKIFDPFFTRKKKLGSGMGLAVSQVFVEKVHGTLKAENRLPEGGAVFTVEIPCSGQNSQKRMIVAEKETNRGDVPSV